MSADQREQEEKSALTRFATRRLYRDWKELQKERNAGTLTTITALPTSDISVWHCNLRPDYGPFAGTVFHLVLRFPVNYPHSPPNVGLCTYLSHPNVFHGWSDEGYGVCLDMIQGWSTGDPYAGWTSAYSVLSLLLQLQSFLFAENIPQDYGGDEKARRSPKSIDHAIRSARAFWYETESHDGTTVIHTHEKPWPPLPRYKGKICRRVLRRSLGKKPARQTKLVLIPWQEQSNDQEESEPFQLRDADFPSLSGGNELSISYSYLYNQVENSLEKKRLGFEVNDEASIKSNSTNEEEKTTVIQQQVELSPQLPSILYTNIFSFLEFKDILRSRDVCCHWRSVVMTYNLLERSQVMCFHSKSTLDEKNCVLGVGMKVEYYPDGKALKSVTSPLDLLSLETFREENVRTGVWGGRREAFDYFLPLIIDNCHAQKAVPIIEQTVHQIMMYCILPEGKQNDLRQRKNIGKGQCNHKNFHPHMIFQLLAVLMNTMVVQLMNHSTSSRRKRRVQQQQNIGKVNRYASEKALEGYCAFHHMLLYFSKRYPALVDLANVQVNLFLSAERFRNKSFTPNLGLLLVCLTLSRRGWDALMKPLVIEVFDRNVRWLLQKYPELAQDSLPGKERLEKTFEGAKTSLRLLMFQVFFMSCIGRPKNATGPFDVLHNYEKRLGKPTTAQKDDLQQNAKDILAVQTWTQFFQRLGGQIPTEARLVSILWQAVRNSERKRYHRSQN
mmetsp:Transcript_54354/g.80617  ORF Transcript_54354/g.80617 Transcript_54354/m.80617 type:complete len:727 (-) Transcript_54354:88-2268(-)